MSMFGIGLGGFMDGYQKMAESQREDKRSAILDEQLKLDQKRAARQDKLEARDDAEYDRGEKLRTDVAAIGAQAKQTFDQGVEAGKYDPKQFDEFYRNYAVPQIQNRYLLDGNTEKAADFMKWSDTEGAKIGGRYAMAAMWKANNGDLGGALDDAIKAGQTAGYIDHGYEFVGKEVLADKATGAPLGYRVRLKDQDGKEQIQDIPNDKIGLMVATYLNPQSAYESRTAAAQAAAAADGKDARELKNYEDKKKIDKKYEGGGKSRGSAIEALRKRMNGEIDLASGKPRPLFDDLSREEKEGLIKEEMALQSGAGDEPGPEQPGLGNAATTPRKVVVDTVTSEPVAPPVQQQAAPAPQQQPAGGAPAAIQQQSPKQSRDDNIQYMIEYANDALSKNVNPLKIAEELQVQGVPREMWPEKVQAAAAQSRSKQIGLGQ